jgi:hypothetical protein
MNKSPTHDPLQRNNWGHVPIVSVGRRRDSGEDDTSHDEDESGGQGNDADWRDNNPSDRNIRTDVSIDLEGDPDDDRTKDRQLP